MNKKDDIRNFGDGMEEQGSTQALPKLYPSFTQGLGLLKSMARVWLEYAYSMSRVCLKHACATSMLRRCYADATPMLRLQYAKSMSGVCQESVSCERPVRNVRTLSPSRANTQSASFVQFLRYAFLFVVMMIGFCEGVKAQVQTKLGKPISGLYNAALTATATGTTAEAVVLNDLEDHNWSYYSDSTTPSQLHSLNPADVTITYYGNGQDDNNMTTTDASNTPTSFGAKAEGVQVGPSDAANTFVYYKTLERANANGSGNLPYTPIPNPFQVRPTYGTPVVTTSTVYISGSAYGNSGTIRVTYTDANGEEQTWSKTNQTNQTTTITVLDGTTLTVFAQGRAGNMLNRTYSTVTARYNNAQGNQIASVTCTSNNYTNGTSSSGTVGTVSNDHWRGFYAWRIKSLSEGLSIDGKSVGDIVKAEEPINFVTNNASGNTVEFEALWAQAYVTTGSTNLTTYVPATVTSAYERNFHVVNTSIAASNFQKSYPCTVIGRNPNSTTNNATRTVTGDFTANAITKFEDVVFGNATTSTYTYSAAGRGLIIGRGCSGTVQNLYGATSAPTSDFTLRAESGTYTTSYLLHFTRATQVNAAITMNAIYGSDYDRANNETNTKLTIAGATEVGYYAYGTSANAAINMTVLSGTIGLDADNTEFYMGFENGGSGVSRAVRTFEMYGGNLLGGLAGGFEVTGNSASDVKVNMRVRGGTIHRYLYASGQYSECSGARRVVITGGTFDAWVAGGAYGRDNENGNTDGNMYIYFGGNANQTSTAGIYGGGYGMYAESNNKYTVQAVAVVVADDCQVAGNVYGGGNNGYAKGDVQVYVTGGKVSGDVYGGANMARSDGNIAVSVYGGSISGAVYGGSNQSGAISGNITVDIYGTDPAPSTNAYALGAVFGGGNQAAYNGKPEVTVHNCDNSIEYVYGGGNAATVQGTDVTIYGGNKIGNVFGGCYGANVTTNGTKVKIYGGTIGRVFGGSNSSGTITGGISVTVNKQEEDADHNACAMKIGEVYSGGNMANSNAGSLTIGCTGDLVTGDNGHAAHPENIGVTLEGIGAVYGGANQANIGTSSNSSNITLNINSGMVANVFGGNNTSGDIYGTITVNVNKNAQTCGWYVGNVFGAGNLAQYTGSPAVNILNGTVSQNVYGGGKGNPNDHTKGQVTGNPVVTIGDATKLTDNTVQAVVTGDVYGGGDAGNVVGTPQVNVVNKCNTTITNVYGGGNAADVNGTDVNIDGGNITGMVFGGGHGDKNANPQTEANVNGNVAVDVTGGTINKVFGGSNSKGTISGSVAVNIAKGANSCEMHITEVYGGGNEAAGNAGTITIGCTGGNNEGIVDVYGGANAADINNNIALTIKGGNIQRVFGGNNQSGSISGTIAVEVNWDSSLNCGTNYLRSVFGGGNVAAYSGSPTVTLTNGTVSHSVYGGGNEAGVGGSLVNINGGSVIDGVYGGCNTSGNVSGNIVVNINGGTLGTYSAPLTSGIFGGGFGKNTTTAGNVTVNVGDANAASADATSTIYGDIYGGSALGTVNDAVADVTTVNINNGTIHGNIYGGGLGSATLNSNGYIDTTQPKTEAIVNGTVHVNIGTSTQASNFVTIDGQVFGCNNLAGSPKGPVYVDVYKTAHTTANTAPTPPAKAADVTSLASTAFAIGAVYGGGNLAHYTTTVTDASTHVTIHNCDNTIEYVYGGGNAANSPATEVTIEGGRFNYIFGGGNGAGTGNPGANIEGNATATITGGVVYRAFGGSNTKGTIGGTSQVILPDGTPTCDLRLVHEIFGGGNEAPGGSVDMVIPCGTTGTGIVYAGANNADMGTETDFNNGRPVLIKLTVEGGDFTQVFGGNNQGGTIWGNVELYLKGGTIGEAFGGNNLGGNIKGTIKVFVDEASSCGLELTDVYGGGFNAAYTPADASIISPIVYVNHLKSGNKILGSVYGGGYGELATVTANPKVIVGDVEAGHESKIATIAGNVYGGGNAAKVVNSTTVLIQKDNSVIDGRVFGAGKGSDSDPTVASVDKDATVTMTGGWVKTNIYGGGEMASVGTYTRDAQNVITGVTDNTGTTTVTISGGTVGPDGLDPTNIDGYGNVFGGGLGKAGSDYSNFAYVNMANVNVTNGTVRGSVFGGGENGHVKGNTNVTIGGGIVGVRIPYQYRNISSDEGSSNPVYAGNVYGGGRGVDHTTDGIFSHTAGRVYGNTNVSVTGGQIHHSVYGGGSLASVGTYTLTEDESVYGGYIHNFTPGTGIATVNVSGGRIGPTWDELLLGDDGNSLVDGNGDALNTIAANQIAHNYECLGENEGMVYGSGRGVNYPNDDNDDHKLYVEMAFTNNTFVTISGNADVVGSVFGGGENGHVKGNTQVNIQGGTIGGIPLHHKGFDLPGHTSGHGHIDDEDNGDEELNYNETGIGKSVFRGNVYGGGRGIDHTTPPALDGSITNTSAHIFSVSAGRVYGNTEVNVTGGNILHNVFGGGSIASVGTYTYPNNDFFTNPNNANSGTGKTTVNVSGGRIGVMGENEGYVYGGGRGIAGTNETQVSHLAFVNETVVNIGTGSGTHADVRASVFGGGMNGHVLTNTKVTVSGGVVGGKTAAEFGNGANSYDPDRFPSVPSTVDYTINGTEYYSGIASEDAVTNVNGVGAHTVFLGNVYGGGRGVDVTSGSNLSYTAGRVYGNTEVVVTGGVIYHSVFGGGSIASVGTYTTYTTDGEDDNSNDASGSYGILANQPKNCTSGGQAKVTITGDARIGTDGLNSGRVFGSSRGMAGASYRGLGYVNTAIVTIGEDGGNTTNPQIRGSVFGSGENGHVLSTTQVNIKSGHIGNGKHTGESAWMDDYVGNVYGGGRGIDPENVSGGTVSPFAGRVYGATEVNVSGGQIDHNVYGGGSLASVGRYKRNTSTKEITYSDNDEITDAITNTTKIRGTAIVNISGGTIGIDGDENGHVFGSSRGTAASNLDIMSSLAYVNYTNVTVSGNTARIWGSVFGGGESGHVQHDANVTVSGGEIGLALPNDYASLTDAQKAKYELNGNVYGAGRGVDTYKDNNGKEEYSYSAGYVRGNTNVEITGGTIHRNVYGGGSMGIVGDYGPFGLNDFYESDASADNNGKAKVTIKGAIGTETDVAKGYGGNVFGSSRGVANNPNTDSNHDFAEMSYSFKTEVNVDTGADVLGNVYGGGENGHVDFGGTTVTIKNGRVRGNVFGGGKGNISSATAGIIDGPTRVYIGTSDQQTNTVEIDGDVFAGNDTHSSPLGEMRVDVYCIKSGAKLNNVYGGGNLANVLTGVADNDVTSGYSVMNIDYITQRIDQTDTETPDSFRPWPGGTSRKSVVYVHTGNHEIGNVFGGGKMANCKLTEVTIDGGVTTDVYGGGEQGDVTETTRVDLVSGTVTNVYGGGLGKKNGFFGSTEDVAADVGGNVIVNLNGGSSVASPKNDCVVKGNIFGCNNLNGTPKGHVTVHVYRTQGWTDDKGTPDTSDDVRHTRSAMKDDTTYEVAAVYGGGNMAAYVPTDGTETTDVIIDGCDLTSIEYVYGGGNAASVPNAKVTVNGTYEIGTVFGGGNGKDQLPNGADNPGAHVGFLADGTTTYTNGAAGTVDVYLNGGTIHEVFGGSNTKGSIRGKAEQHINEAKDGTTDNAICPLILDEVYGGGNVAYMEGGTDIDLGCISSLKAIYGGARNADVGGDIVLTITSGHFDRVFGGNNLGGCIRGSILVNIEETGCNPITIGELYGCGNKAAYSIFGYKNTGTDAAPVWEPRVSADDDGTGPANPYTSPKVNVKSFTSIGNIFGGGLGQEATVVGDPTVNIDEIVGANAAVSNWSYNGSTVTYNAGTADEYKVTLPTHTVGADKIGVIGTVYGGGNAAPVIGNTNVNIGTQSEVEMESLPLVNGNKQKKTVKGVDIKDNVFGGGLGSTATVSGNTNVKIGKENNS